MKSMNKLMFSLVFVLIFIMNISPVLADSAWREVGDPLFSTGEAYNISLDIDSVGVPYVAYSDGSGIYGATVMKFDGSTWVNVGEKEFSAGEASGLSFSLDNNDVPYVVYADEAGADKAIVMKYTGLGDSGWEEVGTAGTGFSVGAAWYTSIDFDNNNVPYVAYSDIENSRGVTVVKYASTTDEWVNVGSVNFSNGRADHISLAVDGDNSPYVAYRDYADSSKITTMKYTGVGDTGWEVVGSTGFSTGRGAGYNITQDIYKISLVIDEENYPYVAYSDGASAYEALVMKYTGLGDSGWEEVGTAGTGFSAADAWYISLDFDNNNVPYVVYSDGADNEGATLMKYASTTNEWINIGGTNFSDGAVYFTTLDIHNDIPYVAYAYYYDNGYETEFDGNATVMNYSSLDSLPPSITGLVSTTTPAKSVTWSWASDDATATYRYSVTTSDSFVFTDETYGSTTTISQVDGNGIYYLYVEAKNSDNITNSTRVSAILDNLAPVIEISGNNPELIYVGSTYIDNGATAVDAQDGLTMVVIENNVNTSIEGIYSVTYSSTDIAGNTGNSSRQVTVLPKLGTGMPPEWLKKPRIPAGGFQIVVNQGSDIVNRIVNLDFNAEKDVAKMAISLSNDFQNASLENYQPTKQLDLCSNKELACPGGLYTVYVKFYTKYGISSDVILKNINFINHLSATSTLKTVNKPVASLVKILFKKDLKYGQVSSDVKELQKFLNKNLYLVAKSGPGSPGKETTYFGVATRAALAKFQKAKNIVPSVGYFGPLTRKFINGN